MALTVQPGNLVCRGVVDEETVLKAFAHQMQHREYECIAITITASRSDRSPGTRIEGFLKTTASQGIPLHHDNHYSFKAPATNPSNCVCGDVVIEELVLLERLVNGITCYLRRHYLLLTRNIALNTKP